jgi:hypothetical protein
MVPAPETSAETEPFSTFSVFAAGARAATAWCFPLDNTTTPQTAATSTAAAASTHLLRVTPGLPLTI